MLFAHLTIQRNRDYSSALAIWQDTVEKRPGNPRAHNNLGVALEHAGRIQEAIAHFQQALCIKPDFGDVYNNWAWLLATSENLTTEDRARAVELAERACQLTAKSQAGYLDTLAAAYAATDRFGGAIKTAQKAIVSAQAAGQTQLVSEIEARLSLYRTGHVYRELVKSPDLRAK